MNELCEYAYEVCRRSINVETINAWVDFVEAIPPHFDHASSPDHPRPASVFGLYAQKLRDQVFHYLVVALPSALGMNPPQSDSSTPPPDGREMLLQIYSRVPFEIFKAALESPSFQIGWWPARNLTPSLAHDALLLTGTDQARFKFAKDAIDMRKRGISRGGGAEETVVLAFGTSGGSAVHVTRKMRKRPLWKVNNS
jgi:hypothetical protein